MSKSAKPKLEYLAIIRPINNRLVDEPPVYDWEEKKLGYLIKEFSLICQGYAKEDIRIIVATDARAQLTGRIIAKGLGVNHLSSRLLNSKRGTKKSPNRGYECNYPLAQDLILENENAKLVIMITETNYEHLTTYYGLTRLGRYFNSHRVGACEAQIFHLGPELNQQWCKHIKLEIEFQRDYDK